MKQKSNTTAPEMQGIADIFTNAFRLIKQVMCHTCRRKTKEFPGIQ